MEKKITALILLLVAPPLISNAQDDPSSCHSTNDDAARLACYDNASGYLAIAGAEPGSSGTAEETEPLSTIVNTGKWQIRNDTSAIDDSTNVYLSLDSDEYIRGRFGDGGPMRLYIHCREDTTMFYIGFNGLFMSDYQHGTVTYRLDDAPAQKKRMRESNDNSALGLWNGGSSIPFIKGILGHEKMLVRATPHSETSVTATFSIAGIDDSIISLREACHW